MNCVLLAPQNGQKAIVQTGDIAGSASGEGVRARINPGSPGGPLPLHQHFAIAGEADPHMQAGLCRRYRGRRCCGRLRADD